MINEVIIMGKIVLLLMMVLMLPGCELLGLQNHQGDLARFNYKNGECEVELWQSGLEFADTEKFSFDEVITITPDCSISIDYTESQTEDM